MNLVILCGNLVKKGELRATKDGGNVYSFTIAVRKRFTKEEQNEEADFISCSSFGKTAENMDKYLDKGSKILIQGRLQVRKYEDKDGNTKYATNVLVDTCTFLNKKQEASAKEVVDTPTQEHEIGTTSLSIDDDSLLFNDSDLPF